MRWLLLAILLACLPASGKILRGGGSGIVIPSQCISGTANQIAACATWLDNPLCSASVLGDYYWEIDSATAYQIGGQTGTSIGPYTLSQLDSGSKPIYGAYVVQYRAGISNLTTDDVLHLHQQSGYVNQPTTCPSAGTVLTCLAANPGVGCTPSTSYTVDNLFVSATDYGALCTNTIGLFHYNGGNKQSHAALDLPSTFYNLGTKGLANAVNTELNVATLTGVTITNGVRTITNTGTNNLVPGEHVYLTGTVPAPFVAQTVYYVTSAIASPTATSFQLSATKGSTGSVIVPTASSSATTVTVMPFTYSSPLLAGGANQSAKGVIAFLQNVIGSSPLLFNGALGAYESCTNYPGNGEPSGGVAGRYYAYSTYAAQTLNGTTVGTPFSPITVTTSTTVSNSGAAHPWISNGACQTNVTSQGSSPIPENVKYAIAHWVESDPAAHGDGAFSGIGARGAYFWVEQAKGYVGILMRVGAPGTGYNSMQCGRLIRRAFDTGIQQTGSIPTS